MNPKPNNINPSVRHGFLIIEKPCPARLGKARAAVLFLSCTLVAAVAGGSPLFGQNDTVTQVSGPRLRGTVESSTADKLVISTSNGKKEIAASNVRVVRFEGSNELIKAKSAFRDDRFQACFNELQNLETLSRPMMIVEAEFYMAVSAARAALQGGKITTDQAATLVRNFIEKHPNSFHYYKAVDTFGDLALATGRFKAASEQFAKTAECSWPQLAFTGKIKAGKALLYSGDFPNAISAFQAAEAENNGEAYAVQAKLIARCLRAQAMAQSGKADEGKKLVLEIIANESSRNVELFGHAYNALGLCHMALGESKEAIRAFLFTDLLFAGDPDSHPQALFHLISLWSDSDRPDRSARARQKLTQRFRNTHWAGRIRKGG